MSVTLARLIKEATVLVNQSGLDGLSMTDLARALNVRTPTLYSHVSGLGDVKRLLGLHGLAELNMEAMRATIGRSGPDSVRAMLNSYRRFAEKNPGLYAATIPTPARPDRDWRIAVDTLQSTVLAALQHYDLKGDEVIHTIRGMRSLVHGFVSLEAASALKHPVGRDASFNWLVEGFLSMLEQRSVNAKKVARR